MEEAEGDPYPEQANNWAHIGALWETGMGSQTLKRIRNTLHDLNFDIDQVTSISTISAVSTISVQILVNIIKLISYRGPQTLIRPIFDSTGVGYAN